MRLFGIETEYGITRDDLEQVVGISSFRRGRQAEERLVGQII